MPWRREWALLIAYSPNFRLVKISGNRYRIGIFYLDNAALKSLCFQRFAGDFAFGTALATVFASDRNGETDRPKSGFPLGGIRSLEAWFFDNPGRMRQRNSYMPSPMLSVFWRACC